MARTIIDVIEAHFGEQLGPDLIRCVDSATFHELRLFQSAVREFTEDVELVPRPPGQVRPYVPTERQGSRISSHDFYLRPGDFKNLELVEQGFQALKHHLLYCHSLAMDDPLPYLLDVFVLDDSHEGILSDAQAKVLNCFEFLSWIRPLIESDVVVLVENGLQSVPAHGALKTTDHLIESVDFGDLPEELSELLAKNGDLARLSILHLANKHLGQSLQGATRHPDALDLYLPYRHHEELLRVLVEESGHAREAASVGQMRVLRNLLDVPLPTLATTLEVSDVIAIREQEFAFEQWRRALELGLNRVDAMDPLMLGLEQESLRVIRQELDENRRTLESELQRSRFLAQALRSRKDFVIGGLGLAINPTSWPSAGLSAMGMLWDFLAARRDDDERVSALRHYLLFAPSTA